MRATAPGAEQQGRLVPAMPQPAQSARLLSGSGTLITCSKVQWRGSFWQLVIVGGRGFVRAVVQIFVLCSLAAKGCLQTTSPFKVPLSRYKNLDPIYFFFCYRPLTLFRRLCNVQLSYCCVAWGRGNSLKGTFRSQPRVQLCLYLVITSIHLHARIKP